MRNELNFSQLVEKLNKINWTSTSRENESLKSTDGWEVKWVMKTNLNSSLPSLQVVFQLKYNGSVIKHWGCEDDNQQRQFLIFFENTQYSIDKKNRAIERTNEIIGNEVLNKL